MDGKNCPVKVSFLSDKIMGLVWGKNFKISPLININEDFLAAVRKDHSS